MAWLCLSCAEHYSLLEEVGQGVSAVVRRAIYIPFNQIVAIKILDFKRHNSDLNNISREAQTMILVDYPNVLKSHCSFVSNHNLWVVMPFMSGGSCLHLLKAANPYGFEKLVIATILGEVLKCLDYLLHRGHIHRDVKAGNILIDVSDEGIEEKQWKLIGQYIASNGGGVTTEELAPYLDLDQPMKASVADQLFRHSDVDVKVVVASYISEITRMKVLQSCAINGHFRGSVETFAINCLFLRF